MSWFAKMAFMAGLSSLPEDIRLPSDEMARQVREEINRKIMKRLLGDVEALDRELFYGRQEILSGIRSMTDKVKALAHTPLIGVKIQTSTFLVEWKQYRFPRSKKRRIRRKWAKRGENYRYVPDPRIYLVQNELYMHPKTLEQFKVEIKKYNDSSTHLRPETGEGKAVLWPIGNNTSIGWPINPDGC